MYYAFDLLLNMLILDGFIVIHVSFYFSLPCVMEGLVNKKKFN